MQKTPMTMHPRMSAYDAAQTDKCQKVAKALRRIATLVLEAQDVDPSGDPLADILDTIEIDLRIVRKLHAALNTNDVFAAVPEADDKPQADSGLVYRADGRAVRVSVPDDEPQAPAAAAPTAPAKPARARVEVHTADYEFAHGKAPRGQGGWIFAPVRGGACDQRFHNYASYGDAKRKALVWARKRGFGDLWVLS